MGPVGPFPVTWSQLIISVQTAVLLFPVNLVIGRLFLLLQPQEPLPLFPPSQASCPSDATSEPLSLTKVAEVSLVSNFIGRWRALLPRVVRKASRADPLEGSRALLTLIAFP